MRTIAFVTVRENAKKQWSGRSGVPWRRIYGNGIGWVRKWMWRNRRRGRWVKRRNGDMVRWDRQPLHVATPLWPVWGSEKNKDGGGGWQGLGLAWLGYVSSGLDWESRCSCHSEVAKEKQRWLEAEREEALADLTLLRKQRCRRWERREMRVWGEERPKWPNGYKILTI